MLRYSFVPAQIVFVDGPTFRSKLAWRNHDSKLGTFEMSGIRLTAHICSMNFSTILGFRIGGEPRTG